MKRLIPLVLLAVACTYGFAQSGRRVNTSRTTPPAPIQPPLHPEPEPPPTRPTPSVLMFLPEKVLERRIKAISGNNFRLSDFHGKVLVINLWASWCGPCRREVPEYESVRKDFAGREVEFIGLTPEDPTDDAARVDRFVRETRFSFLLGWVDGDMARTLMNGRSAIPQTIVVGTDGAVINHWIGYARGNSGNRLKRALESALK